MSVISLLLACMCVASMSVADEIESDTPHNLLVIYVDDLGYGDTGAYGHPVVSTPNIDRLAAEGVRFTQFYAPSALCSPSRAGLLTGRTPYRTGVENWIPDDSPIALGRNETTLADLARERDFRTAVIGKWHLNGGLHMSDTPQPRDFGFDHQYGLAAWVKNAAIADQKNHPRSGEMYPDNFYRNNEAVGPTQKYSAELVSDEALAWLDESTRPFFLFLTYSEVHTPIASPESFRQQYASYLSDEALDNPLLYYFDWRNRPSRGQGEYYANITFLDTQLGRVIEHLRERDLLDNTLIVFSSDNGPVTAEAITPWELGMAGDTAGLRGKKRFLFEGGIRVPGIIRYPARIAAGQEENTPVSALDIFPTVAQWLDVTIDAGIPLDGQSLWPLLSGEAPENNRTLYWSLPTPDGMEYALRRGDWKLILTNDGEPRYLFNLTEDFYEVINRIDSEPAILEELLRVYQNQRASVGNDPLAQQRAKAARTQ